MIDRGWLVWVEGRSAGADGESIAAIRLFCERVEFLFEAVEDGVDLIGRTIEERDEFVATEASDDVCFAQGSSQDLGRFAQGFVAGVVPQIIVDDLQAIEIHERDAEGVASSEGDARVLLREGDEAAAVVKAGEIVSDGERGEFGGLALVFGLQFGLRLVERGFAIDDSAPGAHALDEFSQVERLGDVTVGTGAQALAHVLVIPERREEQNVRVARLIAFAHAATDFDAVETRHAPVEDGDLRRAVPLQQRPSFVAVTSDFHVETLRLQSFTEEASRHNVVVGN